MAKQQKNHIKEFPEGGSLELDAYAASRPIDPVEALFLEEIVRELSPQAKDVAKYIRMGYTWREIGETLGVDYSAIRKSFRRETDAILIKLGRGVSCCALDCWSNHGRYTGPSPRPPRPRAGGRIPEAKGLEILEQKIGWQNCAFGGVVLRAV